MKSKISKNLRIAAVAISVALTGTVATVAPATAGDSPFIGELMLFAGNFCPRGWLTTDGHLLPISSNQALFSLLGTMYGGDGRTTFAVPDLRGRAPIGRGTGAGLSNIAQGKTGGSEMQALSAQNLPSHHHSVGTKETLVGVGTENVTGLKSDVFSTSTTYGSTEIAGQNQAFSVRDPYLGMNWCISTTGTFPSRS